MIRLSLCCSKKRSNISIFNISHFKIDFFFIAALFYSIIALFTAGLDSDSNQKGATRNVILGPKMRHCRNIYVR